MGFPEYLPPDKTMRKNVPTLQDAARPHPRLFGSHEDPWRPRRDQRTSRQGRKRLAV